MALHFKISNALEGLAHELVNDFKHRKTSLFQADRIVTQTVGMNNWLRIHMAGELGILANVQFLQPMDSVALVYQLLDGPRGTVLTKEYMQWKLFAALKHDDFTAKYPALAHYYQGDTRKRMAFAERIADLFDQYQIYRPEMVKAWGKGKCITAFAEEQWQQALWQYLFETGGNPVFDRMFMHDHIVQQLQQPLQQQKLKQALPALYFFGLSIVTPYQIHLFQVMSAFIDIHFYILNPAPYSYWMEDLTQKQIERSKSNPHHPAQGSPVGNTLLLNFGKVIKDTFRLFFDDENYLNTYTEVGIKEPVPDSLLRKIQSDIFFNLPPGEANAIQAKDLQDGSIIVNSCYTKLREVEVLYNFLVRMADKGQLKTVQEVLVMVTDIDAYVPYIKAVFDNAPHYFPYTLADHSLVFGDTALNAIHALLQFDGNLFMAEDVLQLLEFEVIAKRFGITKPDYIRRALIRANCLFGADGRQEDETKVLSFAYAQERFLLDYCLKGQEGQPIDIGAAEPFYPIDFAEGAEGLELIRFAHFVEMLRKHVEARNHLQTMAQWLHELGEMLENFIVQNEESAEEELSRLNLQLDRLQALSDVDAEPISYEVFCQLVTPYITADQRNANFLSGGITFSSLIPMRSVPFPIIAVLGLNFDQFPRHEKPLSFDLMQKAPKLGDRNIKDNDKHLFLETLLSAGQILYMSYLGSNTKDNSAIPPSALVEELLEYTGLKANRHPLHNFSSKYNAAGQDVLYSYALLPERQASLRSKAVQKQEIQLEIETAQFLKFFDHPVKYFFKQVLGIHYETNANAIASSEPFELDHLQKWVHQQALLEINTPERIAAYREQQIRAGRLPLKNFGALMLQDLEQDVVPLRKLLMKYRAIDEKPVGLVVSIDQQQLPALQGRTLSGVIQNCYQRYHIVHCTSKSEYKYLLKAYLEALLLAAAGHQLSTVFVSQQHEEAYELQTLSAARAAQLLTPWVQHYAESSQQLWPFAPTLLKPYDVAPTAPIDTQQIASKVQKRVEEDFNPLQDLYLLKLYELGYFQHATFLEQFGHNSVWVHQQLVQAFPSYSFPKGSNK